MVFDQSNWVWMNGRCVAWEDATAHVSVHALHYGTGVFEGVRCYATEDGPAVFRMQDHLDRLYASAAVYGMKIPYSPAEMEDAISEVILRNGFKSCYVRPICFYGSASLGLNPRNCPVEVAVLAWPWAALHGDQSLARGVRVTVSRWSKFHSQMMPTTAKACGQYLNSVLAVTDATNEGYDEALLLDAQGFIAEGAGENLFLFRDGKLYTNDERHSILLGITRDSVINIARGLGYEVEIGALSLCDLINAEEAFLTGTAAEVAPLCEIDGTLVGKGVRGEVTAQIQKAFFDITSGRDTRYRDWLHMVCEPVEAVA